MKIKATEPVSGNSSNIYLQIREEGPFNSSIDGTIVKQDGSDCWVMRNSDQISSLNNGQKYYTWNQKFKQWNEYVKTPTSNIDSPYLQKITTDSSFSLVYYCGHNSFTFSNQDVTNLSCYLHYEFMTNEHTVDISWDMSNNITGYYEFIWNLSDYGKSRAFSFNTSTLGSGHNRYNFNETGISLSYDPLVNYWKNSSLHWELKVSGPTKASDIVNLNTYPLKINRISNNNVKIYNIDDTVELFTSDGIKTDILNLTTEPITEIINNKLIIIEQ